MPGYSRPRSELSLLDTPKVAALLERLHRQSDRQAATSLRLLYLRRRLRTLMGRQMDWATPSARQRLADKLVALDPEKCRLCYMLCRAAGALRVVEVGTSFGVSTIYLAAAVHENAERLSRAGRVIGTEWEPAKVARAYANLEEAGLAGVVEILEGDVRETLRQVEDGVDFVLLDIWVPVALPALQLLAPRLRPGAMVFCYNVTRFRREYRDYLTFVRDPANGFHSVTLPQGGGVELSVWLR